MTTGTKIGVLGTGANGGAIAADMTRAGLDVTLIEQWPAHVEAMRSDGLRVNMPGASELTQVHAYHLCDVATLRDKFDLVFVLVKAYDTRWACELIKPLVKADGLVVGLQNGMTVDAMADVVGRERTIGAVIEVASNMFTPGVVNRDTPRAKSWFAVGGIDPATEGRGDEVAAVLMHSGTVETTTDIRSSKWMKLVANATELATSAILDMSVMECITVPGMREIMVSAGVEAVETALALGHRIVPIFGMAAKDLCEPRSVVEALLRVVHDEYSVEGQKTTVLQDWIKGRRSEVNEINGYVVDQLAVLGRNAPVNEAIVKAARLIERGELDAGRTNAALLLASPTPIH
jgi:2-dehydropantoate 2-reductase